jgi:hypothetical protein
VSGKPDRGIGGFMLKSAHGTQVAAGMGGHV